MVDFERIIMPRLNAKVAKACGGQDAVYLTTEGAVYTCDCVLDENAEVLNEASHSYEYRPLAQIPSAQITDAPARGDQITHLDIRWTVDRFWLDRGMWQLVLRGPPA